MRICNHEICDGNVDDPTYAYCDLPAAHGGEHQFLLSREGEVRGMLTKDELLAQYEVLGFSYGMCVVRRKSDGVRGVMLFTPDADRRYYDFQPA